MAIPHASGRAAPPSTLVDSRATCRGVPAPELSAVQEACGRTVVVRLAGVLCSDTAAVVREEVDVAVDRGPASVVLDLTDVVAGDGLGLWVLPAMAGHLQRRHVALLLVVPGRVLRQRLRRLGGRALDIVDVPPTGAVRGTHPEHPGAPGTRLPRSERVTLTAPGRPARPVAPRPSAPRRSR